jgi:hypothetical protein
MTSRELRTRRRAEERKARKQERRQLAAVQPNDKPDLLPGIGFVSQKPLGEARHAEVNRQNAQHSTSPRTPKGKKDEAAPFSEPKIQTRCSSRNSTKHGLASGQIIIPGEDPAAFDALLSDLLAEHQPANTTEELLIAEMAQSHWLAQRAIRLQNDCSPPTVLTLSS